MVSWIFWIRIHELLQPIPLGWKRKQISYWSKKLLFFLSFEHLKKSKQLLHGNGFVEKNHRFDYENSWKHVVSSNTYVQLSSSSLSIPISSIVSAIHVSLSCFSKYNRSKLLLTGEVITLIPLERHFCI